MSVVVDPKVIKDVGSVLANQTRPLKERFRALFTLKALKNKSAVEAIAACFDDPSALLKHELAYCLGQMGLPEAIPYLNNVLADTSQEPMVRHEAAEALGAIGTLDVIPMLEMYLHDPVVDVAETCEIALGRLNWLQKDKLEENDMSKNPYASVDPAPPSLNNDVNTLKKTLIDENATLFERYRAMFSLRNMGTVESVQALGEGLKRELKGSSALFRHEIAFVLGQMQHDAAIPYLRENLEDLNENEMVRHECAEALGAIANDDCVKILENCLFDKKRVVKESCEIALDMCEYENSPEFQYADTAVKLIQSSKAD